MAHLSGFYSLSEELLTMIACELDGPYHDVESLKTARLIHPRLASLKCITQRLFGILRLFPEPSSQRMLHPGFSTIAPYTRELILLPAVPKHECAESLRYGKAVHLLCAAKGEAITQPGKDSAQRTISMLQQMTSIRTITFDKVSGSCERWPERKDYQTIVMFYLWCLGKAKVKPRVIKFDCVPIRAFLDRIWLHEHKHEFGDKYRPLDDEQWKTAWEQLDVSELKEVYMDVTQVGLYQCVEGLVTILDKLCKPQLERLAIKRFEEPNLAEEPHRRCVGSSGEATLIPCTGQTTLRHLSIDGGLIRLVDIIPWIKANPNLSELCLARVRSMDMDGDAEDNLWLTGPEEWHSLFTAIRFHPSRMLVRLTEIRDQVVRSQPRDYVVNLVHHTSNPAPEHSDKFCKMLMEYMSGVGIWEDKLEWSQQG